MYSIPLDKLYKVIASCQYNEKAEYCPVLVKIIDPTILMKNNQFPFLLQVWTLKGEMVFERPLRKPISNWNISYDKFVFQENRESSTIFVVRLFMDQSPVVFKFNLPEKVVKNRINSYFDPISDSIVIPKEVPKEAEHYDEFGEIIESHSHMDLSHQEIAEVVNEDKMQDARKMAALGELQSMYNSKSLDDMGTS